MSLGAGSSRLSVMRKLKAKSSRVFGGLQRKITFKEVVLNCVFVIGASLGTYFALWLVTTLLGK